MTKSVLKSNMLRIEVFNSVKEIPVNDWQIINGENVIFTSLSYLLALEQSRPAGLQFRYVIVYNNEQAVATLCFQLLDVANKDLGGLLNLKDKGWLLQNLNKSINRLLFKCQTGKVNFFRLSTNNLLLMELYLIFITN